MISTLFFDFSGTIVHGELDVRACRQSVVEFLRSKGYNVSQVQYDEAIESAIEWRRAERKEQMEVTSEELERETLGLLGIRPEVNLISRIEGIEFKHYNWELFPRVEEVLRHLNQKYRLGIISNSCSNSVFWILKKKKRVDLFDTIVLSKNVGFRKPDPRIFEYALKITRVLPEEALFIGDSFVKDVLGAKNIGMNTIWITHDDSSLQPSCDAVATEFTEIPRLISELPVTVPMMRIKDYM